MKTIISEILIKECPFLTSSQLERFEAYAELICEENKKYNLTAITEETDIAVKHFADSLAALNDIPDGASVIDIGSGAGLPGIPLLIVRHDIKLTLLDATEKKTLFIKTALNKLGLNASVVCARAEEAQDMREKFDIAVSRAVAPLRVLCELCMPFVKIGGMFIAYKGKNADEELREAKKAIETLGGGDVKTQEYVLPDNDRKLIIIGKKTACSQNFPRQYSKIKKNPL